jgi:uncharacterized cupin superfamily protein
MTGGKAEIARIRTDGEGGWEEYPLPPHSIVSGAPAARVRWARVQEQPPYYAGVWTVEPCAFDYTFELTETAHILEGRVVVSQKDGPRLELGPGDLATFPKGAVTRWDVRERLKKVFVDA